MVEKDTELDRIVREILGDCEMFHASHRGPNGPWTYEWVVVTRNANRIHVMDVDGKSQKAIEVADLSNGDDAVTELKETLESVNEEIQL